MIPYVSYSKESQDLFVLSVLDKKREGAYLEVGSAHPRDGNNTFLLESEFGWRGVSIEIRSDFAAWFSEERNNPCVCADAQSVDYNELLTENNLGPHIDFLQLDIDPTSANLNVLNRVDFDRYSFSVITFEHNRYLGFEAQRIQSREFLLAAGYTLVVADVCTEKKQFEDWYVLESAMPSSAWTHFVMSNVSMDKANIQPRVKDLFERFLQ